MDLQTRNQYMKAMGIPVWLPRMPPVDEEQETVATGASQTLAPTTFQPPTPEHEETHNTPPPAARPISIGERLTQITGIPTAPTPAPVTEQSTESAIPIKTAPDCSQLNWSQLQQSVVDCQLCGLHKSRTQTVFGAGSAHSDWMIIGEAPGAEEDKQGQPFVGRAGKLLNNMLAAAGLPRNAVYVSNVLKCRPPNNRDPKADEATLCRGYLERQIALVNPTLIIVVGRIAAHNLLGVTTPLGRLRGTVHTLPNADTPVIVTYHPAYLLRQPAEKRKSWQDLQLARQVMAARQ